MSEPSTVALNEEADNNVLLVASAESAGSLILKQTEDRSEKQSTVLEANVKKSLAKLKFNPPPIQLEKLVPGQVFSTQAQEILNDCLLMSVRTKT